jgi:hypothetical protein
MRHPLGCAGREEQYVTHPLYSVPMNMPGDDQA